ncbi:uncharacterized protein JCM15063_004583 [Sporobolomyces koalae]|uniref:uncharacterized protein n=1 Tax=Sporobolomyces koalae TaxID=500713 RepID=UPI00317378F9
MPLWTSHAPASTVPGIATPARSSSSGSDADLTAPAGGRPASHRPHLDRSTSTATATSSSSTRVLPTLSKLSISDDDPWQDGSDDEAPTTFTIAPASPSSRSPRVAPSRPPAPPPPAPARANSWFQTLTSPFSSSSSPTAPVPPAPVPPASKSILRRQPSAQDVANALSPTISGASMRKLDPEPGVAPGPRLTSSTPATVPEQDPQDSAFVAMTREQLKQSIRPQVSQLVRDPTTVLPRLRREWFSPVRACPADSNSGDPAPLESRSASIDSNAFSLDGHDPDLHDQPSDRARRAATDNEDDENDDEDSLAAKGYVSLNARAISSSTFKPITDYHLEYNNSDNHVVDGAGGDRRASSTAKRKGSRSKSGSEAKETEEAARDQRRRKKFLNVLQGIQDEQVEVDDHDPEDQEALGTEGETDLGELRKLSWGGIPERLRPIVWMLLLGYLPSPFSRRASTLQRKRQEYQDAVELAFARGEKGLDGPIWHQIKIDVPRTRPGVKLWMVESTQRSLERILYVWAIRHPASGYVQGINDLVCPFFQVFLSLYIDSDPEEFDPSLLDPEVVSALEADSFWCLSKLLDGIQDNYIFAQPGITRAVKKMESLCNRVDARLAKHLQAEGVEFIQFAFRWMNCLLMRELSVKNIVRMWDTYLAEGGDAFSEFHLYVCLSFLVKWSEQLRTMDFQSIIMFLQSLPTRDWKDSNTELLLSEAFMWSRTFEAR